VGGFVGAFFDAACATAGLPARFAAVVCQAASLWLTGCFHEDGLADSSDGIGGGWTRSQILRIMSDTRLGTYGCAVLVLFFCAKVELVGALGSSRWSLGNCSGAAPALLFSGCLARWTAPYLVFTREYVEENGPKSAFYGAMVRAKRLVTLGRLAFATASSVLAGALLYGFREENVPWGLLVAGIVWLLAHCSGNYAQYLLGGVVGDYLGATVCVAEVVVLTLVLARDRICGAVGDIRQKVVSVNLQWHWDTGLAACSQLPGWRSSGQSCSVFLDSPSSSAALRFLVICVVTYTWCRFVGGPDVFVVEEEEERRRRDVSKVGVDGARAGRASEALECDRICADPETSFIDRYNALRSHIDSLAMPLGALGLLEDWAARLGALQRTSRPTAENVSCLIFAGDHGVAKARDSGGEECSAYSQNVTRSILNALEKGEAGGAGGAVLAAANAVDMRVVDVGVASDAAVVGQGMAAQFKLKGGTKNFCQETAMTAEELEKVILSGRSALRQIVTDHKPDAVILGEIGIGNTTCASTLLAALTGEAPELLVDGGARVARGEREEHAAVARKVGIVKTALARASIRRGTWKSSTKTSLRARRGQEKTKTKTKSTKMLAGAPWQRQVPPAKILAELGGAEVAAIVGAILEASDLDLPVLVDGFISSTAALVAALIAPHSARLFFLATRSGAAGHACAVRHLQALAEASGLPPLPGAALDMRLRLGEGTGGVLAAPTLRAAAAVLRGVASLAEFLSGD
jgi:nicotinate-nucleotide--dimethylbenzimidazole phosphoribosyltransferase